MGMNAGAYKIKGFLKQDTNNDDENTRNLFLNESTREYFINTYPNCEEHIAVEELINLEQICIDVGADKNWAVDSWDLEFEAPWIKFLDYSKDITEEHFFYLKNPTQYIYSDGWKINCVLDQISDIRKPFMHHSPPNKIEEDGTLVITVDNFAGSPPNINKVLGDKECEKSYLIITQENIQQATELKLFCLEKQIWQEAIINPLIEDKDIIIIIDW